MKTVSSLYLLALLGTTSATASGPIHAKYPPTAWRGDSATFSRLTTKPPIFSHPVVLERLASPMTGHVCSPGPHQTHILSESEWLTKKSPPVAPIAVLKGTPKRWRGRPRPTKPPHIPLSERMALPSMVQDDPPMMTLKHRRPWTDTQIGTVTMTTPSKREAPSTTDPRALSDKNGCSYVVESIIIWTGSEPWTGQDLMETSAPTSFVEAYAKKCPATHFSTTITDVAVATSTAPRNTGTLSPRTPPAYTTTEPSPTYRTIPLPTLHERSDIAKEATAAKNLREPSPRRDAESSVSVVKTNTETSTITVLATKTMTHQERGRPGEAIYSSRTSTEAKSNPFQSTTRTISNASTSKTTLATSARDLVAKGPKTSTVSQGPQDRPGPRCGREVWDEAKDKGACKGGAMDCLCTDPRVRHSYANGVVDKCRILEDRNFSQMWFNSKCRKEGGAGFKDIKWKGKSTPLVD
ncbi:hypothetical protein FKW77_005560 [Venturia effusa]|uniref:Extracellular membrane protein CFEM domain-containing protein n=1 Tax=Venturia effusa TaxID=50376 RepID=A0A517LMW0_9PEZI|nr:hypothetical protein FKW77_005560 [Venturia effusa]